jgi:HTH-type transcriptional regulator, sugar sensing transcriptional regulator
MLSQKVQKKRGRMKREIEELVSVGLTENEAKTYVYLLKKQVYTATEISRVTGVNRSKIYDVLDNLIHKGLCFEKPGKVRKYEAIEPTIAFCKLREQQKEKLTKLDAIPELLEPIFKGQKENASPLDFIEIYTTPASIIHKYNTLELLAENFVYSFCKRPYAMADTNIINPEQLESMSKGVVYKSIFESEPDQPEWFAKKMQSFVNQGEEIRISHHLPLKLHIYDKQTVMFSMINKINPKENLTYLVISHEDLAETLISTFQYYWEQAMSVEEYCQEAHLDIEKIEKELQ